MTLRHECERNGCYKDKLPDWAILDGCFPRGIRPSDVDGIVEINGYFLMLEWKPLNGFLTRGQLLMFQNITASSPKGQVLVIYGDRGNASGDRALSARAPTIQTDMRRRVPAMVLRAMGSASG